MSFSLDPAADPRIQRSLQDVVPLPCFDAAAQAVLAYLSSHFELALWMVTRTAGEDWVVLRATESPYGVRSGDVLHWPDSVCARMVRGEGPRVAPRLADVAAYRDAPITRQRAIGTYVGIPLTGPDGALFGTLCGIDPEPSASSLPAAQPLLELQGRLLSSLLAVELAAAREGRAAQLAEHAGPGELLSPGGWQVLLEGEQRRCAPHATPTAFIALEIEAAAGSAADTEVRARRLLQERRRTGVAVARTGLRSYALLCPETLEAVAQTIATDLVLQLQDAGVTASCGVAGVDPRTGDLRAAWRQAEQRGRAEQLAGPATAVPVPAQR